MPSDDKAAGKEEMARGNEEREALKCPSCGADMLGTSDFCPRCGRKAVFEEDKIKKPPINIKKSLLYLGRDVGIAVIIVLVILGMIFAYTRVWPPMVVIESASMQHGDSTSYIGVIDTGDLVLVQAATQRSDVITWVEGKATGYMTYGNYGDVIIYKVNGQSTPIIHRPMFYMEWDSLDSRFDIMDLEKLPRGLWQATYFNGTPVVTPQGMDGVLWLYQSGWDWNLTTRFDIHRFLTYGRSGYVTMGDNNAYNGKTPSNPISENYDHDKFPSQEDIVGKARGELPWFGLFKLMLSPGEGSCCPNGWGDSYAARNSWDSLLLSIALIIATPIIFDISTSILKKKVQGPAESQEEGDDSKKAEMSDSGEPGSEEGESDEGEKDGPPQTGDGSQ